MALEEELAELDAVLGDVNSMMKDLNVQSVLEFFPNNNNNEVNSLETQILLGLDMYTLFFLRMNFIRILGLKAAKEQWKYKIKQWKS